MINAISSVFPDAHLTGCLFHLAKNLYKKVVELGHKVTYETSSQFNQCIKCFSALAFLPPTDVLDGFLELTTNEMVPIDFISYFEVNYIGAERGSRLNRHRTEPPFPIKLWNVFDRVNNDQPRTNNSIEAFHNALQTVTNSHPTIWRLIECLRREEGLASKRLVDLRMGNSDRKKKYRSINEKLDKILKRYDPDQKRIFLENISACLHSF